MRKQGKRRDYCVGRGVRNRATERKKGPVYNRFHQSNQQLPYEKLTPARPYHAYKKRKDKRG